MQIATVKLRQIQHFVTVAETLNFRRAADLERLSQQALSKSIMQLEEQIGVRLFDRGRQSVILTEQGSHLLPFALEVISSTRRLGAAVTDLTNKRTGSISVGATPTFLESILPDALDSFQRRFPETPVMVERGDFSTLCAAMIRGDLDIILSTAPGEIPRHLVKALIIGQDRNIIAVRAGHPLAGKAHVSCADLLDYPQMVTINYPRGADYVARLFAGAGLDMPRPALKVGSTLLGIERVENTDAWWVTPQLQVRRRLETGAFARLAMAVPDDSWDLIMAIRRHSVPSRWTASFQTIVREAIDGRDTG